MYLSAQSIYSQISRKSFEIIYVSQNCMTMEQRMRREEYGGWPYISCEDPAGEKLLAHYKIKRLPAVIIVNPAGIPIAKYTQTRLLQRSPNQLLREWLALC
ncbi:hypothetical protein D918_06438 [Trichuris suis]|nr:hypothetical protein D918_06438 [Trichuris suis]